MITVRSRLFSLTAGIAVLSACLSGAKVIAAEEWRLLAGDASSNTVGNYPAAIGQAGIPGARQSAVTWTDTDGNAWMFGGRGLATTAGMVGALSDIWRYSPQSATWTWMGGGNALNGTPTFPDKAGKSGVPGARYGAVSWQDSGNIWVFGGNGYTTDGFGTLSDLWRLDMNTLVWTYEGGPTTVNSGGTFPSDYQQTGQPPARSMAASGIASNNDLILFGGSNAGGKKLNDMWRYSPANKTWTWIAGSHGVDQPGQYPGIVGQAGYPGARSGMACWTDSQNNLWIFGGHGYTNNIGLLNDLWKYVPGTHAFYWMGGSNTASASTVYPTNVGQVGTLGCRNNPLSWYAAGKFWINGGYGVAGPYGRWNDLWSFDPTESVWRFAAGPKNDESGTYPPQPGQIGVPKGRMNGCTWTIGNKMYLFGGTGDGSTVLSDLWMRPDGATSNVEEWSVFQSL